MPGQRRRKVISVAPVAAGPGRVASAHFSGAAQEEAIAHRLILQAAEIGDNNAPFLARMLVEQSFEILLLLEHAFGALINFGVP